MPSRPSWGRLVELDPEAAEHPSVVAAVSAASRLRKDVPEVVEQGVLMPKSDVARASRRAWRIYRRNGRSQRRQRPFCPGNRGFRPSRIASSQLATSQAVDFGIVAAAQLPFPGPPADAWPYVVTWPAISWIRMITNSAGLSGVKPTTMLTIRKARSLWVVTLRRT